MRRLPRQRRGTCSGRLFVWVACPPCLPLARRPPASGRWRAGRLGRGQGLVLFILSACEGSAREGNAAKGLPPLVRDSLFHAGFLAFDDSFAPLKFLFTWAPFLHALRYNLYKVPISTDNLDYGAMLGRYSLIRDEPLFLQGESYDRTLDIFNHEAYAKAIYNVIANNDPPLSIGLFGPWGAGKSTVVGILFRLIENSPDNKLKPIYFNAWKYSGDSFRRQFLINFATQVYKGHPEGQQEVRRLEQLNHTQVLREEIEKSFIEKLRELLSVNIRLRETGLARLLLAATVLLVGAVSAFFGRSFVPFVPSLFAALLIFFLKLKFEDLFLIQENAVYDPQLIFPEQFEKEFGTLAAPKGPLGDSRAVVVIDDIDRCEAETVRDILISIKTFLGHENCYFIVPCDDKSIVRVFQGPNQERGYREEELRKYFNVGIRMSPLMDTDLVDFANAITRTTGMPQSVVQMAILANCRDARKMKHFLNIFTARYAIAKSRKESGFLPFDVDSNLPAFAKAVLLQDLFPDLYARMVQNPELYRILEKAALGTAADAELEKFGLNEWSKKYPGLSGILQRTREVSIDDAETLLSLKTTNPESRIPNGRELSRAIIEGNSERVDEILQLVATDEHRTNVKDLLVDHLRKASGIFLKNVLATSLRVYNRAGFLADSEALQLRDEISYRLLHDDSQKVTAHNPQEALRCVRDHNEASLQDLLARYEKEIGAIAEPLRDGDSIINAIYQFAKPSKSFVDILNGKFEIWVENQAGLAQLLRLDKQQDLQENEQIPSKKVLAKIANSITSNKPESTTGMHLNSLKMDVLFKYWTNELAPNVAQRILQIFVQYQSDTEYLPPVRFAIESMVNEPRLLEPEYSPQILPHVQNWFSRVTEENDKAKILKLVMIFAAECQDSAAQVAARSFLLEAWKHSTDEQLRQSLAFIGEFEEQKATALEKNLLEQEFSLAEGELDTPTDRTKQRLQLCYDYRKHLTSSAISAFLLKALKSQDSAFPTWQAVIHTYLDKLEDTFPFEVAETSLSLTTESYPQERQEALFALFARTLSQVKEHSKPQLLHIYFPLCEHADIQVRNAAASILGSVKQGVDEQNFQLRLNALFRNLCDKNPAEIPRYRPVLDAAMKHKGFFGDDEWDDLGGLVKRLLLATDSSLNDQGLDLFEQVPKMPEKHEVDLVQALVNLATTGNDPQSERSVNILKALPKKTLASKSRKILEGFLKKPE